MQIFFKIYKNNFKGRNGKIDIKHEFAFSGQTDTP